MSEVEPDDRDPPDATQPSEAQQVMVPQHVLDRLQAIKRRTLDRMAEREHKAPDPQQERNEP